MNIKIKVHRTNKEDWSVKAYVSIVFDEKFKVTGISIRENSRGNLFVSMPSYRTNEVKSDGTQAYKQFCHPVTKEFNKELSEGILKAYREGFDEMEMQSGTDDLSFYIKTYPMGDKYGNVEALVTVIFNMKFAVNAIKIVNGKNGKFVAMPSQLKSNSSAENEYVDLCYPVTREFRGLLYENIFKALDYEKTEKVSGRNYKDIAKLVEETAEKVSLPFK
ncbi:MAG: SpoVG family protein [Lachnospiraceae bacterium]|nr:SpoVG family protein [Lachnospiraceae bacterium]